MSRLQETYNELKTLKAERRELNKMFQDELKANAEYQKILEDAKVLRERKKGIENSVKASSLKDTQRMDDLKLEISSMQELLSDLSLNMYLANETVEIVDAANQRYVPHFKVSFKKD